MKIEIKIINVTPEFAGELLKQNFNNRTLSKAKVKEYAEAMRRGRWTENNDAICIFEDGTLANGQHRLHAVIESGKTIPMTIKFNVPKDAVFDRGRKRSLGDNLIMQGFASYDWRINEAIALVRFYLQMAHRGGADYDVADFLKQHKDAVENVMTVLKKRMDKEFRVMANAAGQAALLGCYLNGAFSFELLDRFCEVANTGFCKSNFETSAIVIRNARRKIGSKFSRQTRADFCCAVQFAIRDFSKGVPRQKQYTNAENI